MIKTDQMTHSERVKCTMDFKEPDRVPIFDMGNWTVNMAGNNMNCIDQNNKDVTFPEFINNPETFVDAHIKAFELFNFDFVQCKRVLDPTLLGSPEILSDWDRPAWGKAIDKVEDWRDLEFPDVDKDVRMQTQLAEISLLKKEFHEIRDEDLFISGTVLGPFAVAAILMGVSEFMLALMEKPDEVKEFLDFCADVSIECAKVQFDAGADQVFVGDSLSSGSLISREFFREFSLPSTKRHCEAIKKYKDKYAYHFHICGETMDRLEDLAEIGASMVTLDSCVDFSEAKDKAYGKFSICGNIDPVNTLYRGTPEQIEEEGQKLIKDAAPGGGFIYGAGCDTVLDTPLENIKKFHEVAHTYGNYPINV
ncbi:uroporphyrinogen decarboxylase family protein [Methanococcoides methylutens]|uniref:uroporphyrinogen decarboxylase family protein n=1 Tax=Methanococcoides methylutens TaxID=2226 RepID=UPI004045132A